MAGERRGFGGSVKGDDVGSLTARQGRTIVGVGLASAVVNLDFMGFTITLPAIGQDLDAGGSELEWIMNGYLLAYAAPLIAIGRVGDLLGLRRVGIAGAVLFMLFAAVSGLAESPLVLILSRMAQGLGSAMIFVIGFSMVSRAATGPNHAVAIGYCVAFAAIGSVLGPFVAGLVTDLFSWRMFFWLGGVLMGLGLLAMVVLMDKDEPVGEKAPIDWAGFFLLTASLASVIFALELVQRWGWLSFWAWAALSIGLLGSFLFYRLERRIAAPLVDFALARNVRFLGSCLVSVLVLFPYGALTYFLSLYLQHILGYSALQCGSIFLAMTIPVALLSFVSGPISAKLGILVAVVGSCLLMTAAFVLFGFAHGQFALTFVLVGLVVIGAGRGIFMGVTSSLGMAAVSADKAGAASGILQTVRNVSLPLGVATAGALFRTWENERLAELFDLAGNRLSDKMQNDIMGLLSGTPQTRDKLTQLVPAVADRVHLVVDEAFSFAFRNVMFLSIAFCVAGLLVAVYYFDRRDEAVTETDGMKGE